MHSPLSVYNRRHRYDPSSWRLPAESLANTTMALRWMSLGLLRSELCRVHTEQSTRAVERPASLRHRSGVDEAIRTAFAAMMQCDPGGMGMGGNTFIWKMTGVGWF